MGSYTTCIDYKKIDQSAERLYDFSSIASVAYGDNGVDVLRGIRQELDYVDDEHDNCFSECFGYIEDMEEKTQDITNEIGILGDALSATVKAFDAAENGLNNSTTKESALMGFLVELDDIYGRDKENSLSKNVNTGAEISYDKDNFEANTTEEIKNKIAETTAATVVSETSSKNQDGKNHEGTTGAAVFGGVSAAGSLIARMVAEVKDVVTTEVVSNDVIRGEYGNGQDRVDALTDAGYDYDKIQKRVNEKMGATGATTSNSTGSASSGGSSTGYSGGGSSQSSTTQTRQVSSSTPKVETVTSKTETPKVEQTVNKVEEVPKPSTGDTGDVSQTEVPVDKPDTNTNVDNNVTSPDTNNNQTTNVNPAPSTNNNGGAAHTPVNNSGNNISYTPQSNNGGGNNNYTPQESAPVESGTESGVNPSPSESTTVTEPKTDVSSKDNIISIDKTPSSSTTTKSSGGSSVIPTVLGVGAAGAAAVGGALYIKKKNSEENDTGEDDNYAVEETDLLKDDYSYIPTEETTTEYSNDELVDDSQSVQSVNDIADHTASTEPSGVRYQAGSVNKLNLEEAKDVKIEDDDDFVFREKEELE